MNIFKYILGMVALAFFGHSVASDYRSFVAPVLTTSIVNTYGEQETINAKEKIAYTSASTQLPKVVNIPELKNIPQKVEYLFICFASPKNLEFLSKNVQANTIVARFNEPVNLDGPLWESAKTIVISSSREFSFAYPEKLRLEKLYTSQPVVQGIPVQKIQLSSLFEKECNYIANLEKGIKQQKETIERQQEQIRLLQTENSRLNAGNARLTNVLIGYTYERLRVLLYNAWAL